MINILDSRKVAISQGPTEMVIDMSHAGVGLQADALRIAAAIEDEVERLGSYMERFRRMQDFSSDEENLPASLYRMIDAVEATRDPELNTLAAVAGALSDMALDLARETTEADRIIIDNGGDIAFYTEAEAFRFLLPGSKYGAYKNYIVHLPVPTTVTGICTSGVSGRGFSQGIADFVTVLAKNSAYADAAATHLGNWSYVEDDMVFSAKAEEIDAGTDIPGKRITLKVGDISAKTRTKALLQVLARAEYLCHLGTIEGVIVGVKGKIAIWPEDIQIREYAEGGNYGR